MICCYVSSCLNFKFVAKVLISTDNRPKRTITKEQINKIAEQKMPDLNAASLEAAASMIAGTARSMGITVVD